MEKAETVNLRRKLDDRTYEAGIKLLDKDAVTEVVQLSPTSIQQNDRKNSRLQIVVPRLRTTVSLDSKT